MLPGLVSRVVGCEGTLLSVVRGESGDVQRAIVQVPDPKLERFDINCLPSRFDIDRIMLLTPQRNGMRSYRAS